MEGKMLQQSNLDKIELLVNHAKSGINLCVAAYKVILNSDVEEQPKLLKEFIRGFKNPKRIENLDIPEVFDDDLERAYKKRYQRIIDGRLEELLHAGLSKDAFYVSLAKYIMTDENLLDDGARAFALFNCCIDKRLPYACVDLSKGLSMDQDDYSRYLDELEDDIERINYILNANLAQKTQEASLVLQELDNCDDYKKRTMLLTAAFRAYEVESLRKTLLSMKLLQDPAIRDLISDD